LRGVCGKLRLEYRVIFNDVLKIRKAFNGAVWILSTHTPTFHQLR
jgi:hypothetical protein